MQYRVERNLGFGILIFLLGALPTCGDTAAGMVAFKNKDYETAFREWKAAAEAGQAEAQFDLGVMYAHGRGVPRDLTAAMRWYRKAAEHGNAEAEFALGQLYSRGWGVPRDEVDAMRWFELANDPESNGPPTDWAVIEGYGVERDQKQAAYWYQMAAEKGHAAAEYFLGRLYGSGKGVPRDEERAMQWVRAAASQGYAPAQARFGMRYAKGRGIAQNHRLAYFWLTLAFLQGDNGLEKLRKAEAAQLTSEVVVATEQAAQNWKPRVFPRAKP